MKRIAFATVLTAAAFLVLSAFPSWAEDAKKITVSDAVSMAAGLRNMDGHVTVIKQNGQDTTVMTPWEFGSGTLRLRIANDLAIVAQSEKLVETTRAAIVSELTKGVAADAAKIIPGTPEFESFQKQMKQVLDQPAPGTQDLARIKASELKLDKNEIPVTVLFALAPILDMDIK